VITEEKLAEMEARVNAATRRPWSHVTSPFQDLILPGLPSGDPLWERRWVWEIDMAIEDAEFIAHARDDVPSLVREVRRLRAEVERLEYDLCAESGNSLTGSDTLG
jgi:hypothetical protein